MLKDSVPSYNQPASDDLSAAENHEVTIILDFIDRTISGFRPYYLTIKDSNRENRISDFLVYYFNVSLRDEKSEGFPSFDFGKNPTQAESGKETDIGVVVLTKGVKPVTIIEFEAKRLSDTSNNKEYVCGTRGGIERFKREHHSAHLNVCGMFGYVQSKKTTEWAEKINSYIVELSNDNKDTSITWDKEEQLTFQMNYTDVDKWYSSNKRTSKNNIGLYHYFINLVLE